MKKISPPKSSDRRKVAMFGPHSQRRIASRSGRHDDFRAPRQLELVVVRLARKRRVRIGEVET